jgi:hypothetical protein
MSGPVASVRVVVDGPPWLRWLGSAQAEARAGPATTHTE